MWHVWMIMQVFGNGIVMNSARKHSEDHNEHSRNSQEAIVQKLRTKKLQLTSDRTSVSYSNKFSDI